MNHRYQYTPEKCWVVDQQKLCYATKAEAEAAAAIAQHDHHAPELHVYHCDFADHWHLSSK